MGSCNFVRDRLDPRITENVNLPLRLFDVRCNFASYIPMEIRDYFDTEVKMIWISILQVFRT